MPDSQVVYEVLAGQSFSLINIYLQLYIEGNELSIYRFHSLPFAAVNSHVFMSYEASEITIDIPDSTSADDGGFGCQYKCHTALMTDVVSPIHQTCDEVQHKLPVAQEVFPQTNGTFLISKKGMLHAICTDQPPITRKLQFDI